MGATVLGVRDCLEDDEDEEIDVFRVVEVFKESESSYFDDGVVVCAPGVCNA